MLDGILSRGSNGLEGTGEGCWHSQDGIFLARCKLVGEKSSSRFFGFRDSVVASSSIRTGYVPSIGHGTCVCCALLPSVRACFKWSLIGVIQDM